MIKTRPLVEQVTITSRRFGEWDDDADCDDALNAALNRLKALRSRMRGQSLYEWESASLGIVVAQNG